ncbi:hypothetical protein V8D89_012762 [Ganoderma adspersum]
MEQLASVEWSIGDLLYHLFRTKDDQGIVITHPKPLESSLSRFLGGRVLHTPIEIVQLWLDHPYSDPATTAEHHEPHYSFAKPYLELKHAKAAITAMVVQLCETALLREVQEAVRGSNGLHGSYPGARGHRTIGWSDIGAHTINVVQRILERHQPLTLHLLTAIATPKKRPDSKHPGIDRKERPPRLVAVEVLSTLDFCHSSHARLLPAARSVLYFACHAEHVLWNYGSRVGQTQSFTTTLKTLRTIARQNAIEITRLGVDVDRWFIARFDNVQEQSRQYEQRIGRENTMHIGVAGTVAEVEDFLPSAANLDDRLERIRLGLRKDLTVEKLLALIDFDHLDQIASFQWVQTLVNHIPSLYPYKKNVSEAYHSSVSKLLIPTKKTRIHTLAPVAKNEAVSTELRDTLIDFLSQLGQREDSYTRRLALMGGDGLTFEKIMKVKQFLQSQDSEFRRFDLVMPFLETWHAQWTYLCALFEIHFDDSVSKDPSKLGHSMTKIDQKAPSNLKRVEYYKGCFAAYKTLEVRQLDCWRLHFKTNDLFAYFASLSDGQRPTFNALQKAAQDLHGRYSSTRAYQDALRGRHERQNWTTGSIWTPLPLTTSKTPSQPQLHATLPSDISPSPPPFIGDRVLAQSILFMRDTILSKGAAEAVARGDVGTLYETLKWLIFAFEGSGHSKYSTYSLEMTVSLELESSAELRKTFLRNWLVNPSGQPDGNQSGDIMEEHLNRVLESFLARKDTDWDDVFLKEVVAPNAMPLTELKNSWGTGVGLAGRSGRHPEPHSRPEVRILLDEYQRVELHHFRPGREHPGAPHTIDMFQAGIDSFENTKLDKWKNDATRSQGLQHHGVHSHTAGEDVPDDPGDGEATDINQGELEVDSEDLKDIRCMRSGGSMQLVNGELVVEYDSDSDQRKIGAKEGGMDIDDGRSEMTGSEDDEL